MREAPITPAFVATNRMVAARIPTYTLSPLSSQPSTPMFSTTPRIGSFENPPCSGGNASSVVYSPLISFTGSADRATAGRVK